MKYSITTSPLVPVIITIPLIYQLNIVSLFIAGGISIYWIFSFIIIRKEFLKRRDSIFYRLFRKYSYSDHIDSHSSENSIQWSLSRKHQKGVVTGDPKYRLSQRTFNRTDELETVIRSFRKCEYRRIWIGKVYQKQSRFFKRTCHQQSDKTGSKDRIQVCQCLVRPKQDISNRW